LIVLLAVRFRLVVVQEDIVFGHVEGVPIGSIFHAEGIGRGFGFHVE
jgi:hypothetical protein